MAKKKSSSQRGYGFKWRKIRQKVFDFHGEYCSRCGKDYDLQIDHIIPKHRGGDDDMVNLRVLCFGCHILKSAAERKNKRFF